MIPNAGSYCEIDPSTPANVASAVDLRRRHMAFEPGSLEPGNPAPLYVAVTFRFLPQQRVSIGSPSDLLAANEVEWKSERAAIHTPSIMVAPLGKVDNDSASIAATCRIQSDGSLVCLDFNVTIAGDATPDPTLPAQFEAEARDRLRDLRAAPLLKSGDPAVSRWVAFAIPINLRRPARDVR